MASIGTASPKEAPLSAAAGGGLRRSAADLPGGGDSFAVGDAAVPQEAGGQEGEGERRHFTTSR